MDREVPDNIRCASNRRRHRTQNIISKKLGKRWDCLGGLKQSVERNLLLILIILGMAIGVGLGAGLRQVDPPLTPRHLMYLSFPGQMFLRMLQMLLIPLVVSSLVAATTTLTPTSTGRMGIMSLVYYIGTTTLASTVGLTVALLVKPGISSGDVGIFSNGTATKEIKISNSKLEDTFLDLIRNLVPCNLFTATFKKETTQEVEVKLFNTTGYQTEVLYKPVVVEVLGTNMLGLIAFSLFLGVTSNKLGEKGRPLAILFDTLAQTVIKMITFLIWSAPVGIASLIAAKVVEVDDPVSVVHKLSWYVLTFMVGLAIHGLAVLPLIFFAVTRKNPFVYIGNMSEALITVFSTASSAVTIPVTIKCMVENNKVDKNVAHFIAPVRATVNMDGTAIYQASAAVFLAQYYNVNLTAGKAITICLTSIAGSIGAAAILSASLVVILMVLTSAGIPTDIGLLAAVDWLLDRFRGLPNIASDGFAAAIVEKLSRKELSKESQREDVELTPVHAC